VVLNPSLKLFVGVVNYLVFLSDSSGLVRSEEERIEPEERRKLLDEYSTVVVRCITANWHSLYFECD